jgi:hypothetical protein
MHVEVIPATESSGGIEVTSISVSDEVPTIGTEVVLPTPTLAFDE